MTAARSPPAIGAGEEAVLAAEGNRPVILPMSGRRSRSIIAGTRSMGAASGASTASSASAGAVVHVEAAPGVVIVVAAWMLDPAACAGMALGAPRVAVAALDELHHLLIERGFRRSSRDDPTIVQEEQDEKPADTGAAIRGPAPAQHVARFRQGFAG